MAESKYGSVDKLPPIKLTFSDTPRNRTRNEWLAQNWKKNLGVDLKLDPVDPTTYTALTKDIKTAPQTFILGWCADYPDPQNWLSVYWKTGAFGERIGYSNKELDKLMDQADANPIPADRAAQYAKAQDGPHRRYAGGDGLEQCQHVPGEAVGHGLQDLPAGASVLR